MSGRPKCDLTGQRFGKLVVIEYTRDEIVGIGKWRCRCDCGNECMHRSYDLYAGKVKSCGCMKGGKRKKPKAEPKPKPTPKPKPQCDKKQVSSLCNDCIRSAAPPSLQCIWDKSKATILPEGAKTASERGITLGSARETTLVKVVECPLFLDINVLENEKLLKEERRKNQLFINNILSGTWRNIDNCKNKNNDDWR